MNKTYLILTALSTFLFFNCANKEEKKNEDSIKIGTQAPVEKKESKTIEVVLIGNDMMQYDKSVIKVKAGQEVTLVLKHKGKLDKKVMGHNFVLLQPQVNIMEFAQKASEAGESQDWIPEGGKEVIAHTKMIGGGEEASVKFMAPEVGSYDFVCSFPGHVALMKGKFVVE